MENIFTLTENSFPQNENILPQTDRFCPYDLLFILFFFVHYYTFHQTENIICLADNIYPWRGSNFPLTELYNYAPLIEHKFHFVWLTASHERSPIEGIWHGLRLCDPFVGSLHMKILILFT